VASDEIKLVDLYSLLWLVREHETNAPARSKHAANNATKQSKILLGENDKVFVRE